MSYKLRITIRDDEMSLAFFDFQSTRQQRRPTPRRVHDHVRGDRRSIAQTHAIVIDRFDRLAEEKLGTACSIDKELRRTRRIDHAITRHAQPPNETRTQSRLSFTQRVGVKHFHCHAALRIKLRLALGFGQLLVVSRDPDRATRIVLNLAWQLVADLIPKLSRITRERKLRFRIVHHDEMAHARRSRAAANYPRLDDRGAQPFAHTLRRTRSSDNPGADDHDVVTHLRIPVANGSRSSSNKSDSAVMNAEPLIRGWTRLSITCTRPSKILPTILSCRHTSPSASFPSATRHASFALVPVPHGDRS